MINRVLYLSKAIFFTSAILCIVFCLTSLCYYEYKENMYYTLIVVSLYFLLGMAIILIPVIIINQYKIKCRYKELHNWNTKER